MKKFSPNDVEQTGLADLDKLHACVGVLTFKSKERRKSPKRGQRRSSVQQNKNGSFTEIGGWRIGVTCETAGKGGAHSYSRSLRLVRSVKLREICPVYR